MKMVKSLLLVSAAGLVAVSGAQAADLPVKAKPVEYVKVCSLYGAGFYYIPGTDICLKVGGFVRWQESWNAGNSISGGPLNGTGGRMTRADSQDFSQRSRAVATFDSRQQTAYGTLRTYLLMGYSQDTTLGPSTAPAVYMTRGFIQIAGFTFGKATSFFDFTSTAAVAYNAGMVYNSDTGDAGQIVAAYTAQFGNGVSATIAAEQTRRKPTVFVGGGVTAQGIAAPLSAGVYNLTTLANPTGVTNLSGLTTAAGNVGQQDVVGNLRVDQAWGSAQVSAAAHDVGATYYSAAAGGEVTGHPGQSWGFAVSGGLRINAPSIGPGDYFQAQVIYSDGATGYLAQTPSGAALNLWSGNTLAYGFWEDAVYSGIGGTTGGSIQNTTGWSAFASYEHFWTPSLRTSLYGSYVAIRHNAAATAAICSTSQTAAVAATVSAFQSAATCNPDWDSFAVGSRSQWNVTKDLYIGLDVIYLKLNSASPNAANTLVLGAPSGAKPANVYFVHDDDALSAVWRIHRDIVP